MWLALALAAALFQVLRNTAMKRLGHALDEYINVWGRFTFLLPFALATAFLTSWPALQPGFFTWCLAFGVCQTLSTLALSKALKLADISLVTALWKVSLLILLGMAWATIGERPSALGVAGVLLSAGGVYLLNVTGAHISLWEPLRVLVTDRGQRYTLLAAFFYAPSVITIKQAILASNTAAGTFGAYLAASLIMTPLALTTSARHFPAVPRFWKEFVALGLFAALTTMSQGKAYTLTLSSYVEAVKQIEILFAMGAGVPPPSPRGRALQGSLRPHPESRARRGASLADRRDPDRHRHRPARRRLPRARAGGRRVEPRDRGGADPRRGDPVAVERRHRQTTQASALRP